MPLLCTMQVSIGSTVLDQAVVSIPSTSVYGAGGSARYYTSAAQGTTPTLGTHTITFAFQSASTSRDHDPVRSDHGTGHAPRRAGGS